MQTQTLIDPLDELIPPPRRGLARLAISLAIVTMVGAIAYLWGFGYLYPKPECCGSGNSGTLMAVTPDAKAVTVTASFYNSSGRPLRINSATAELAEAKVTNIELLPTDDGFRLPAIATTALPATVAGHSFNHVLITFTPTSCVDQASSWGTVTLQLDVQTSLPSIGRSFHLPDPVFGPNNQLSVFPPPPLSLDNTPRTPLGAACALLAAAPK